MCQGTRDAKKILGFAFEQWAYLLSSGHALAQGFLRCSQWTVGPEDTSPSPDAAPSPESGGRPTLLLLLINHKHKWIRGSGKSPRKEFSVRL